MRQCSFTEGDWCVGLGGPRCGYTAGSPAVAVAAKVARSAIATVAVGVGSPVRHTSGSAPGLFGQHALANPAQQLVSLGSVQRSLPQLNERISVEGNLNRIGGGYLAGLGLHMHH